MINLIKNELTKVFKRKSIYILFIFSFLGIIVYNYINPKQNTISPIVNSTSNKTITYLNENMMDEDIEAYVEKKNVNDLIILYNKYQENSWQRYALNEEFESDSNRDIFWNIRIINYYTYKIERYNEIKEEDYQIAKERLKKYEEILDLNNEEEFIKFKLENLIQRNKENRLKLENDYKFNININLNTEIELYEFRKNYNIGFRNDLLNEYINHYRIQSNLYEQYNEDQDSALNRKFLKETKEKIELIRYALENKINEDISPKNYLLISNNDMNARNLFIRVFDNFEIILIIISIYISTIIITEEFSTGTIKSLLTKPHKRNKILLAKILTCIIVIIISMIFIAFSQYIVGGIIFGFESYNLKYIGYNSNEIFSMNLFVYNFCVGIAKLPMYLISCLICICLGVINCNSAMTMTLTLIVFILGNSVLSLWSEFEKVSNIFKYFITNNWDFSEYLFGGISSIDGINLKFSIIIYFLYFIILSIVAFKIFEKKEIKNI